MKTESSVKIRADVQRKKDHLLLISHQIILILGGSLQRPAALCKDQAVDIVSVSQSSSHIQRFDAIRARRHISRGLKRFISFGFEIVRSRRSLFQDSFHMPVETIALRAIVPTRRQ